MADKAPTPDWGVIGGAAAAVVTAIAAGAAAIRRGSSPTPLTGTDLTEKTLDGALKLIEQLQEERNRLEARALALVQEVAGLQAKIAALESQVRMLSWPPPAKPPADLE